MELLALVIDNNAFHRSVVRNALKRHDWVVYEAVSIDTALCSINERSSWGLIFCDVELSTKSIDSLNGSSTLLGELKRRCRAGTQIVITATAGRPVTALEAILNGATEYLRKPLQEEQIVELSRGFRERILAAEKEESPCSIGSVYSERTPAALEFIGESATILRVFKDLAHVVSGVRHDDHQRQRDDNLLAPRPSVFITGETGTGKELIARLIHQYGSQANGHFVPINCSNLSPELAESELFGHMPGAFTGATKEKEGLWEVASGGTLFLDEITEAPPSVLPKLLRVLQDGQVKRLGSNRWKQTWVQVIAASNRDIQAEIKMGRFRADLYHRLSHHKLHIPPLRERLDDIPLIVDYISRRHFTRHIRFSQEALDMLMTYGFPGNVRELENIVRSVVRRALDGVVYAVDLIAYIEMLKDRGAGYQTESCEFAITAKNNSLTDSVPLSPAGFEEQVHQFKLQLVREALVKCNNNVVRTARYLEMSRPSLYKLLKDIDRENSTGYDADIQTSPACVRSASA